MTDTKNDNTENAKPPEAPPRSYPTTASRVFWTTTDEVGLDSRPLDGHPLGHVLKHVGAYRVTRDILVSDAVVALGLELYKEHPDAIRDALKEVVDKVLPMVGEYLTTRVSSAAAQTPFSSAHHDAPPPPKYGPPPSSPPPADPATAPGPKATKRSAKPKSKP